METPNIDTLLLRAEEAGVWWQLPNIGNAAAEELAALKAENECLAANSVKAERLLRLTCERVVGTPIAEQSSELADVATAIDMAVKGLETESADAADMEKRIQNQEATIKTLQEEVKHQQTMREERIR